MSDEELIKLAAPVDAGAASWNGREFPVEDGYVSVPRAAIDDLAPHGFSLPKSKKGKGGDGEQAGA